MAACLGRAKPDRRTLDRFQRNLGRGGREERPSRQKRLRDLTERLLRAHTTPPHTPSPPPPPPPPPHSAPVLPPVPPPRSRHRHSPPRGLSVDRYDDFDANKITLVRVEPRSIVGSYAQKTIPYRSASFSQGDFAPDKYYRGVSRQHASIFDFGKRSARADSERAGISASTRDAESTSATEENVTEGGSVASVDSAVGSDEGLLAHASPAPRSPPPDAPHKQLGARSLTHPLPRRVPAVREEGRSEASGSLPALMAPRVLHELREESDGSQADSAQAHSEGTSPLEPAQPFTFPPLPDPPPNACANIDCECVNFPVEREDSGSAIASSIPVPVYECIVKQWSQELPQEETQRSDAASDGSLDREKEDETITSEQVAHLLAAVKDRDLTPAPAPLGARERRKPLDKSKRRKGIYITTASDDGGEEETTPTINGCKRENSDASLQEMRLSAETRTSSLLGDKSDDSCTNGPPSPCEAPTMMWPRSEELRARRARFSHQSSDERDEDSYRARRKYGVISRGDSPSEAESDSCSRDRTASPSPYSPSDTPEVEVRRQQFSRGPFGKTLEAPASRSVEVGRRSLSDATVPSRKTSAGATTIGTRTRGPTHVRATSSPSKLAGVKPGVDLLAELLRGSSEVLSNSSAFDNVVLTLHQHNVSPFYLICSLLLLLTSITWS